ncbi:MAG: hypothetical protein WBH44_07125 [Proteocatella sp.]
MSIIDSDMFEDEILLKDKRKEDFTDEEWYLINEYEYGEEWVERDEELREMSLEEYDEARRSGDVNLLIKLMGK